MKSPQRENGYTAISNELLDALNKIRISGEAHQFLGVIFRKTYGFNKKHDQIATSQFMQETGLPNFAIHKARKKLHQMGIITITKKGDSQILSYSIQKDYDNWRPLPKKVTVTKKGNGVSPKKVTNCNQKSDTQKKERQHTKDTLVEPQRYFYLKYKEKLKEPYVPDYGKDGAIFKQLLAHLTEDNIKALIDRFFESNDDFIKQAGYTTGVFKTQINKLREKPERGIDKWIVKK